MELTIDMFEYHNLLGDVFRYMDNKEIINHCSRDLYNLLSYASYKGNSEIINFILNKHPTIGLYDAFINACKGGQISIINLIKDKSMNITHFCLNGPRGQGQLPWDQGLMYACDNNQKEVVLLMLLYGADNIYYCNYLTEDDIYYLYQKKIILRNVITHVDYYDTSKKYIAYYDKCKEMKDIFSNTMKELLIEDVANFIIEF